MIHRSITPDAERLVGLVFELASQLHVERTQRIALELALERAGVLQPAALDSVAGDAELRARSTVELDTAMAKFLRVLSESADARGPLRNEAAPHSHSEIRR